MLTEDELRALWKSFSELEASMATPGFFDNLDKSWLTKFVEHRVADPRILRLIQKWLSAGVMEDGIWSETTSGTPQGSVASPLLANIYLHYVFDLWLDKWRRQSAHGDVIAVRYADDIVLGFQNRAEAERFLKDLRERLSKFGLELHPDKTRLIEFGRFAEENRTRRGEGKPETFDFLGFTHISGKDRNGRFSVKRMTIRKRMRAKLQGIKQQLRARMHDAMPGNHANDAVKRLHYCHGDSQKRDCHAGTSADRDQDRQQQGDASRSRIPGEAVVPAWAE